LLSGAYTASRPSLLLTLLRQRAGWGCTRSWEGTAVPDGPKGYSQLCNGMLSYKTGGKSLAGLLLLGDWMGNGQLVVSS